jgi:hypothetical protein
VVKVGGWSKKVIEHEILERAEFGKESRRRLCSNLALRLEMCVYRARLVLYVHVSLTWQTWTILLRTICVPSNSDTALGVQHTCFKTPLGTHFCE